MFNPAPHLGHNLHGDMLAGLRAPTDTSPEAEVRRVEEAARSFEQAAVEYRASAKRMADNGVSPATVALIIASADRDQAEADKLRASLAKAA